MSMPCCAGECAGQWAGAHLVLVRAGGCGRLRGGGGGPCAGLRSARPAVPGQVRLAGGLARVWPAVGAAWGSVPMTARGVPMGTVVPSATRMRVRGPSSYASSSMMALSVSISAMTSPLWTVSPSCLSQRLSVPSSMVSDRRGMRTSGMAAPSLVGGERARWRRGFRGSRRVRAAASAAPRCSSGLAYGSGTSAAATRRTGRVEVGRTRPPRCVGGDLGADAVAEPVVLERRRRGWSCGPRRTIVLAVQWAQAAQVDDLDRDAFLFQAVATSRRRGRARVGDDGDVRPGLVTAAVPIGIMWSPSSGTSPLVL